MRTQSEPVGRDEELSTLFGFLEGLERLPGVMILEGDAGAGKTTLFEAGCATAAERGYRALVCRPSESERALSFAALRDLLEPVFDELAGDLRPPARQALAVALLREGPGRSPSPEGVAGALLHLIRSLAGRGAILVGIDDAHWLDLESERVLSFALRRLRDEPVAVLVSTRTARADALVSTLDRSFGSERIVRLPVGPLSLGAIHLVIRDRLGVTLSRPLLQRVHDAAGGNPFFALEIGRALGPDPSGRLAEPLPVSPTLEDIVEDRLAALSQPARALLSVVAAMPRPTWRAVRAFLGSTEADRRLSETERADVLHVDAERIRFAHPLLAAHAYRQLTLRERKTLHARLAETSSDLEERARHLAIAADGPDESVARTLEAAAHDASSRGAPAAAAELLETAAELTPQPLNLQRRRRLLESARARFVSGDSREAGARLSALLAELPAGRLRAEAMAALGRISYYTDDHPAARVNYEGALAEPDVPPAVACEAHDGLVWLLSREDTMVAARHAREAVRLAEQTRDDRALAEALATRAMVESLAGNADAIDLIARGVGMARGMDYPRVVQHPEFAEALILSWSDDLSGALERFERLLARATERQDESSGVRLLVGISYVHLLRGEWGTADRFANEGAEAARLSGQHPQLKMLFCSKALVDAHLGRIDDVRSAVWDGDDPLGDVAGGVERVANGFLELSLGRPAEASRILAPLVERVIDSGIAEPAAVRFVPDHVEALIDLGRLDEAETVLRWYRSRARKSNRHSALAAAARCHGLLLAAGGDPQALPAFDTALEEHGRTQMPFDRARTLLAAGAARRRAKQKRAARQAIGEALEVFQRLGAPLWARQAENELARIGGRTTSPGLTPTERRVAELVASGLSNKEVAATSFVSVKTVEATLSRVYAKLNLRSRTELAMSFTHPDAIDADDGADEGDGRKL